MFTFAHLDPTRWEPKSNETPYAYWASITPMAPFFGVKWRFAPQLAATAKKRVAKAPKKAAPKAAPARLAARVAPAAKPVAKPAPVAPAAVAPAPAAKAAPKPTAKAAPKPAAKPAVKPTDKPVAAAPAKPAPKPAPVKPDDLTRIKGIGPKLSGKLVEAGVTTFAQIAAWTERDVDNFEALFGELPGRIERDKWVDQAKTLASA